MAFICYRDTNFNYYWDMKTKLKLLGAALLAAALLPFSSAAQGVAENDYASDSPFWGLRVSVDVSCPGKWGVGNQKFKLFGPGAGVSLSGVYNRPLGGGLYIEPGIGFFYDTMDADYDNNLPGGPLGNIDRLDAWVGTWGMRVPLMAGYRVDFTPGTALFVSTGPQLEIGFSSHLSDDMPGGSSLAGELYDKMFHRFDCQWKIGVGVAFGYNYYVGVDASLGMVNLAKQGGNVNFHRNIVSISAGYNF